MAVEQVVDPHAEFGAAQVRSLLNGVVDEQVGDVERVDGDGRVVAAIVVIKPADALVEKADIPVAFQVRQAEGLGVVRRACDPQLVVGVLRGADGAVRIEEETLADGAVPFGSSRHMQGSDPRPGNGSPLNEAYHPTMWRSSKR